MGETGVRRITALALSLMLAGCGSTPPSEPPQAPAPVAVAPPPRPVDQCGAADLQALVGRPRSEIPIPIDPARQRVACTTCAVTMDYSAARLNFFFDADTGLIREIRCG
jgi:hypothetical protein